MHIRAGFQLDESAEKSALKVAQRARKGEFDSRYALGVTVIPDGVSQARVFRIPIGSAEWMNGVLSNRDLSETPRMLFGNAALSNGDFIYFVEYYL